MTALAITELTTGSTTGNGVFDVLLRSVKAHLDQQFTLGRIKGPEYATVYLGSVDLAMQTGMAFVLQQRKNDLEAQVIQQQLLNLVTQGEVLLAEKCKLQAEFDLTQAQTSKANQELALLTQKTATEKAQILALGVDDDSVVGRQKQLYQAQTSGFTRDSELKAAQTLISSWNVRRTTDEGTVADATNMLNDATVGRAVNKLLTGIGA